MRLAAKIVAGPSIYRPGDAVPIIAYGTRDSASTGAGSTAPVLETMMTERKTISIMKACELVGVSRRTIYNWIDSGKVEYVRTAGGSVRIFVEKLWREPGRNELTSKEAS